MLGYPKGEWVYRVLSDICHQYPTRSLWLFGRPMALCARCFFAYVGIFAASIYFAFFVKRVRFLYLLLVGLVMIAPALTDGIVQLYTVYISTNFVRSITGFSAGIGCVIVLCSILLPRWGRHEKHRESTGLCTLRSRL